MVLYAYDAHRVFGVTRPQATKVLKKWGSRLGWHVCRGEIQVVLFAGFEEIAGGWVTHVHFQATARCRYSELIVLWRVTVARTHFDVAIPT
jgi:hypothetical protein